MANEKMLPRLEEAASLDGLVAGRSAPGGGSAEPAPHSGSAAEGEARERRLVAAARNGDPDAIRAIYEAYRDRIWTILLYSLGDRQQAQDVLQAVFFKVFRGLSGFRFRSSLFTWIYRIARNECLNARRRRGPVCVPLETILDGPAEIDPAGAGAGANDRPERERILAAELMRLPSKMREVVVLRYVEDLSYDEIGRALGCASGTVASRLSRALDELGGRLGPLKDSL